MSYFFDEKKIPLNRRLTVYFNRPLTEIVNNFDLLTFIKTCFYTHFPYFCPTPVFGVQNKTSMLKKIVIAFFAVFFTATRILAVADDRNKKETDDKKPKREDTTRVVFHSDDVILDAVDSLLMFPSHDLYGSWDTTVIHPYTFDKDFISDSASIYLLDEWNCGFSLPYKGAVTSAFGWRRRRPHFGTDINLETGDTVLSAFDGKVRIARLNRTYGNVVIIRHNNGLETVYAHLSKILVEAGQEVSFGQVIGLGGNTGRSYGSHLHFEVRYLGKAIDAEDLINFESGELKNSAFVLYKDDFKARYDLRNIHARRHSKSYATSRYALSKHKSKTRSGKNRKRRTVGKPKNASAFSASAKNKVSAKKPKVSSKSHSKKNTLAYKATYAKKTGKSGKSRA